MGMGMSKTAQILAFVMWQHQRKKCNFSTLKVGPGGLMQQWVNEQKKWIEEGAWKFICFPKLPGFEEGRKLSYDELFLYDAVLTTYETMRSQ